MASAILTKPVKQSDAFEALWGMSPILYQQIQRELRRHARSQKPHLWRASFPETTGDPTEGRGEGNPREDNAGKPQDSLGLNTMA